MVTNLQPPADSWGLFKHQVCSLSSFSLYLVVWSYDRVIFLVSLLCVSEDLAGSLSSLRQDWPCHVPTQTLLLPVKTLLTAPLSPLLPWVLPDSNPCQILLSAHPQCFSLSPLLTEIWFSPDIRWGTEWERQAGAAPRPNVYVPCKSFMWSCSLI